MFSKHKHLVFTARLAPAQWQKRKVVARDSGIIPGHRLTRAGISSLSVVVAFSCLGRMELNSGPKSCVCLHCPPFEHCYLHRSLFPFYTFVYLGVWCMCVEARHAQSLANINPWESKSWLHYQVSPNYPLRNDTTQTWYLMSGQTWL